MSSGNSIDTGRVSGRRTVRFETIDQLLAELDRVQAAHRAGTLNTIGNWTPGQIVGHLATWAEYSYTGPPLTPPWWVKIILKLQRNQFLNKSLPAGVSIPKVPGGTLGTDDVPFEDALLRLRTALSRLKREAPTKPNVIFGPLPHEDWIKLSLRHAELHLSFMTL